MNQVSFFEWLPLVWSLAGALRGGGVGYALGLRSGLREARRPAPWSEKEAREARAWHEGVAFGQHLERYLNQLLP